MKVEVDVLGSPSLIVHTVSVNVKGHTDCDELSKHVTHGESKAPMASPKRVHTACGMTLQW